MYPKMDGMNRQRIIRALDVWMQTGKPFSSFHNEKALHLDTNTLVFGIDYPREQLYERINLRVDSMIKSGLEQEVRTILDSGFSKHLQALQTVGYREIIAHLEHIYSQEIMIEKIKLTLVVMLNDNLHGFVDGSLFIGLMQNF